MWMRQKHCHRKAKITHHVTPENKTYPGDQGASVPLLKRHLNVFYKWSPASNHLIKGMVIKGVCCVHKETDRQTSIPLFVTEHCLGVHLQTTAKSSRQSSSCLCPQLCSTSGFWTQRLEMHTRVLNTSVLKLDLPSSLMLLSRGMWVWWLQLLAKLYWLPSLKEHWLSIRKPFRPSVPLLVPQVQTKFYHLLFTCCPQVFAEHERKAIVSILASLGFSTIVCSFPGEFCLVPLCLLRGIQTQMLAGLGGNIKITRSRHGNSTLHVQLVLPPQHDSSWRWKFLKTTWHRYEALITKCKHWFNDNLWSPCWGASGRRGD